jgi:hypothetical protein
MRQQICYPPESEISKQIEEDAKIRSKNLVYDLPNGEKEVIPLQVMPGPSKDELGAAMPAPMRPTEEGQLKK